MSDEVSRVRRGGQLAASQTLVPPIDSPLAGAVLYAAQGVALAFGAGWGPLMVLLAVQEVVLAVWLIVKGFASDVAADVDREPQVMSTGIA